MHTIQAPVTIVGGGIAGLWIYRRLRNEGIPALLIESQSLGHGQTIASQGMIHGGQKYALQGHNTPHSESLKSMPARWSLAHQGSSKEQVHLKHCKALSDHQILWTTGLLSAISSFFASKAMNSRVQTLSQHEAFPSGIFKGQLYKLQENVFDMSSVITTLAKDMEGIFHGKCEHLELSPTGQIVSAQCSHPQGRFQIQSSFYFFTSGLGNEHICHQLYPQKNMTQRRPLRQIMVKGDLPDLYGHCITADPRPRITITTHHHSSGEKIWYLGGLLAEKTQDMAEADAVIAVEQELKQLFPWKPWSSHLEIGFVQKVRSESANYGQLRSQPHVTQDQNWSLIWPTKMTFAPAVGDIAWKTCQDHPLDMTYQTSNIPQPQIAQLPWENCQWHHCTV